MPNSIELLWPSQICVLAGLRKTHATDGPWTDPLGSSRNSEFAVVYNSWSQHWLRATPVLGLDLLGTISDEFNLYSGRKVIQGRAMYREFDFVTAFSSAVWKHHGLDGVGLVSRDLFAPDYVVVFSRGNIFLSGFHQKKKLNPKKFRRFAAFVPQNTLFQKFRRRQFSPQKQQNFW